MSSTRARFEKELKQKLAQKATARLTEETILLKNFKYFDLDNSGAVDRDEFAKAIEKAGIQFLNKNELEEIFNAYDSNQSGDIDYHEFVSKIFGVEIARPQSSQPQKLEGSEADVEKFRSKLKSRGGTGILGLGRQFRIFDDNNSRTLDINEFRKAIRDFQIDIADGDIQKVFNFFDRDKDGSLNYDEFLLGVRGPINNYRKKLVEQAFNKFDRDGSGSVTIDDLKGLYNAKFHPDVKSGKKTEDQVLKEFLNTFEAYSDIHGVDAEITKEEFVDYYTFISASIDNDEYFELMINNAWRINEGANKNWDKKGWADSIGAGNDNLQKNYQNFSSKQESAKKAGAQPAQKQQASAQKSQGGAANFESTIEKIRSKLASRGTRGFIGIQRQFKIMDDNNDKAISYQEFAKAIRDYKCELTEAEMNSVFQEIDRDGNGSLSIDELVRTIQGEMNGFRRGIVNTVFNKLDKDGDGVIRVNDIKGVYNAKNHPDVKSGKRTEDDILGEFLETFEMHHNLKGGMRDQNVTREEFIEYYNNISANVDNDQYFELLLVQGFKLYETMPQYQQYAPAGGRKDVDPKGWSQDYSGQFKSKTTSNAPFGTSNAPTDYSTSLRPKTGQSSATKEREETVKRAGAAGAPSNMAQIQQKIQAGEAGKNTNTEELINKFRGKLVARGCRGIFSIGRLFRNMDDDNSKSISFPEFSKVCNEFRMDLPVSDVRLLFNYIDINRNGEIDYDEFLRTVRGTMNDARKKWVNLAFKKLDKDGSGVVNLDDLRGVYNATKHPDVISGKKTEDEILGEFLDTFEVHHANLTGDVKCRDKNVTLDEFHEYYNNISCSIDDDSYFELMMKNAWNFDNVTYQKGWAGEIKK